MLILTRKVGERITVGPDITFTIVKIKGNTVRVGIEAPGHITILRDELSRLDDMDDEDKPEKQ